MIKRSKLVEGQVWPTYEPDDDLVVRGERRKVRRYTLMHSPVRLFPDRPGTDDYVLSNDPRVGNYKVKLAENLTNKFPALIDANGYPGSNGVSGNFYAIRTDNQPWKRALVPLGDNQHARQERGLADSFRHLHHRAIFKEVLEALTDGFIPCNINVAKYSSSGFPLFTSNASIKKACLLELLPHLEKILNYIENNDLVGLYKEFNLLIAYRMASRKQADSFSFKDGRWVAKERFTPDLAFSLTNGKRGGLYPAERKCEWDPRLVLSRLRSVYGMSNTINLLIAIFFDGFNEYLYTEYADTFHSTGPRDIQDHLNKWEHRVAVDVSNHDFLISKFVVDLMFEHLEEVLDERIVKLIRLAWAAPCYTPHPNIYDEPKPFWFGHPLVIGDFNHFYGLPSGIFLVSFTGKYNCLGGMLCKLSDIGVPVLGRVREILKWRHPDVAILDTGDDAVVLFHNEYTKNKFVHSLEKQDYNALGVEPMSYIGQTIYKLDPKDLDVRVAPSAVSYAVNPAVRERDLESKLSRYWAVGYFARQDAYRTTPMYGELKEEVLRTFRDTMGYDWEIAIRAHPNFRNKIEANSWIDLQVLEDPSRLQHRYRASQVSEHIAQAFTDKIEIKDYVDTVTPYIFATIK